MNIIKLLYQLQLEKEKFSVYSSLDIVRLEKRIKLERQINSDVSFEVSESLVHAIKKYPKDLEAFLENSTLTNFLLKQEIDSIGEAFFHPNFKLFFKEFIEEDFFLIFKRKIRENKYEKLMSLMKLETLFSTSLIDKIQKELEDRLTSALSHYSNNRFVNHSEYKFLMEASFFRFLNFFNNYDIDDTVVKLYNIVVNETSKTTSKYPLYALKSFSFFKSNDSDFNETAQKNKRIAEKRLQKSSPNQYRKKKYYPKENHNEIKVFIAIIIFIFNFFLYMKSTSLKGKKKRTNNNTYYKRQEIRKQQKTIHYFVTPKRQQAKQITLIRDTSFVLNKQLKVIMHRKYHLSVLEKDNTPILAYFGGYVFTYNKVKTDTTKTLKEQWLDERKKLAPTISATDWSEKEQDGIKIEEYNFVISGKRKIFGVSKLVEIGEERYFFQFAFKQKPKDYFLLRRYLNYYVKIKRLRNKKTD